MPYGELVVTVTDSPAQVRSEAERVRALYLESPAQTREERGYALYDVVKRILDLLGALLLIALLSPLLATIAALIRLTSSGPAILTQERVGKGGRVFPFYKFRSMYNDTDRSADIHFAREYINGNHSAAAASGGVFKPANDRRITPVGRFIRKASIDELPQLFNVLKGEMSLVGPRPSMPYEVDVYKPWHFRRLEVLPGMTGLAQVRGRSSLTFREIVSFDIDYIDRRSLLLDLWILLKTPTVVFSGRGAR
jgi:lipopolysaccharide/colanic/teichoic acid biosynthesis glycosyltransferase